MDLDSRRGGSIQDHMLLVIDAAVGEGSALNMDDGEAIAGVSLALEGRTADSPERVRWDYLLSMPHAMGITGMLMEQLPPDQQQILIDTWRHRGIAGLTA